MPLSMKKLLLLIFISNSLLAFSQLSSHQKINEVYGNEFFNDKQDIFDFFVNVLDNRISFSEEVYFQTEKYEKISEVGVVNKLNTNILPFNSETFTLNSFNPIRYQLDFYQSKLTKVYRIDNTNYLLIIRPQ